MWRERLRSLLLPTAERDGGFCRELSRLAHQGLRIIGIVEVTAAAFLFLARLSASPNAYLFQPRLRQSGFVILLGLVTLVIAEVQAWSAKSRLFGIVSALAAGFFLVGTSLQMGAQDPLVNEYLPSHIAIVLLVSVIVLPLRPWQALLNGVLIGAVYYVLASEIRLGRGLDGPAPLVMMFVAMLTILTTGLSAVLYNQRYSTYRANLQVHSAEMQSLLAENAASLGRLAAAVSHEMNTPLGALLSGVDTLLLLAARQAVTPPDDPQQPRLIRLQNDLRRSIKESGGRLKEIVTRMQRFTNLDQAEIQEVNLQTLLEDVTALLDPVQRQKAQLELDLQPVPPVTCHPQQLSAVFSTLLTNALSSVNENGVVKLATHSASTAVEVQISDNGRGVEPERLKKIFDPGFSVQGDRVASSNWSLFSARRIIREHGGDILITSTLGTGTDVRVTLPFMGAAGSLSVG